MIVKTHGGWCCGISHIYDIPPYSKKQEKRLEEKTKIESRSDRSDDKGRLVEVVLTNKKSQEWHDAVKRIGYVEVSRFKNSSTANICIVYHYYKEPQ